MFSKLREMFENNYHKYVGLGSDAVLASFLSARYFSETKAGAVFPLWKIKIESLPQTSRVFSKQL